MMIGICDLRAHLAAPAHPGFARQHDVENQEVDVVEHQPKGAIMTSISALSCNSYTSPPQQLRISCSRRSAAAPSARPTSRSLSSEGL